MSKFTEEVIKVDPQPQKGKAPWTKITVKTPKGEKVKNVFGEVTKHIDKLGKYEFTYEKNEKGFWNIISARFIAAQQPQETTSLVNGKSPVNGTDSRAFTVQYALRAASEITIASIEREQQAPPVADVVSFSTQVFKSLAQAAFDILYPKQDKEQTEKADEDNANSEDGVEVPF